MRLTFCLSFENKNMLCFYMTRFSGHVYQGSTHFYRAKLKGNKTKARHFMMMEKNKTAFDSFKTNKEPVGTVGRCVCESSLLSHRVVSRRQSVGRSTVKHSYFTLLLVLVENISGSKKMIRLVFRSRTSGYTHNPYFGILFHANFNFQPNHQLSPVSYVCFSWISSLFSYSLVCVAQSGSTRKLLNIRKYIENKTKPKKKIKTRPYLCGYWPNPAGRFV